MLKENDDQLDYAERQRKTAKSRAAYAPAGPGTPWFSIGPRNVNGRVKCLAVHPGDADRVYAGAASGGVWRSTDGAQSWYPLWDQEDSLAIGGLAISPGDPDVIYAGTGEGVRANSYGSGHNFPGAGLYVSGDGGNTWALRAGLVNRRVTRVLASPVSIDTVFVAGQDGFEYSTDGGATWTTLLTGQVSDACIDSSGDLLYACVHNDGIYRSEDAGASWSLLGAGPTGAAAQWVKIAMGSGGVSGEDFLVCKSVGTVRVSTDAGDSWSTLAGSHGAGWTGWCDLVAVSPTNEDVLFAGSVGLERTTDGGASWVNKTAGLVGTTPWTGVITMDPDDPDTLFCGTNRVFRTLDGCATAWTQSSQTLAATVSAIAVAPWRRRTPTGCTPGPATPIRGSGRAMCTAATTAAVPTRGPTSPTPRYRPRVR